MAVPSVEKKLMAEMHYQSNGESTKQKKLMAEMLYQSNGE
jgi:hypothetical protein